MRKWLVVAVLAGAQFVMVLDGTVMNVAISNVVSDLHTSVGAMQAAITFYTLTMASLMLLGARLGDVWGRRRAFVVGSAVYAAGALLTAVSTGFPVLFIGWSVVEACGAVLVVPAVSALVTDNFQGADRRRAFAVIGAATGAAGAAGPLIGGFVTTYFSWRVIFGAEIVLMVAIIALSRVIADTGTRSSLRIDAVSVVLSAAGLVAVVTGMLESKTWGWLIPLRPPEIGGVTVAPLGISPTAWLIAVGIAVLWWFVRRQRRLVAAGIEPLVHVELLSIRRLRSGTSVAAAQFAVTAGLLFLVPVYLQMTLGLDALSTGLRVLPLSIALILCSVLGAAIPGLSARATVRIGQVLLVVASGVLLASVTSSLDEWIFGGGMFVAGAGLGLMASRVGDVTMSSAPATRSSEVGGLQGVFQNVGSSLGTALVGSVLIGVLATSFASGVASSTLSAEARSVVHEYTSGGVTIIPAAAVGPLAERAGLGSAGAATLKTIYTDAQLGALRVSFFVLLLIALLGIPFSGGLPGRREESGGTRASPGGH